MSSYSTPRPRLNVISFSVIMRTNCGEYCSSACRSSTGPFTFVPSQSTADVSSGTPPSPPCFVRHLASASKFSSANPIGSISLWQLAQGSILAVHRHLLAQSHDLVVALAVLKRRNVRRRLRRRRAQNILQHPHAALHRRGPEVLHPRERQHAALPQQSAAIGQLRARGSRGGIASRKCWGCRNACASRSFRNV